MFWWHWVKTLPSEDQSFRAFGSRTSRVEWGLDAKLIWSAAILY
jgi:hypothetical protein